MMQDQRFVTVVEPKVEDTDKGHQTTRDILRRQLDLDLYSHVDA